MSKASEREEKARLRLEKEMARMETMLAYEREYAVCAHICGIDEAGRGPLALER